MRFTTPLYLILLQPIFIGLWFSYRHIFGMASNRKRLAFGIRALLATLIVFALSGPESYRPNSGLCTVFVLDRSDSITDADRAKQEQFVQQAIQSQSESDSSAVVVFGRSAVIESSPAAKRPLGKVLSKVDGSASDLAGAIRLASATFPEGKSRRIVVLSDGNETTGDVLGSAQVAEADGIHIDIVELGSQRPKGEAVVSSLEVPQTTRDGQPFEMKAVIESAGAQRGTLQIDRDGVLIKELPVHLEDGSNSILIPDQVAAVGFRRYRVTLKAQNDLDTRNNVGVGFVNVKGRPRVLVLQDSLKDRSLESTLTRNSIVTDVATPAGIPSRPEQLQNYDAILFNDINAASFTIGQMKLISNAVRDTGIGFAMIGGENSFLPGGYYGSPIAEVLPVDLNIRQRKSFASASVLIMADASGSMGMEEDGVTKIRLAAKAAEETVKLMSPLDRVGVAGSTDGIEFVAPMQPNANKQSVINQIQKLSTGGGGIYIKPSMDKAFEVLAKEPSKVRHFILLADGADADEQDGALGVALQMRTMKITTSVVSIGEGKDTEFLKKLAASGGGRFYLADRASKLPAIFTQDAAIMSRSAIEEGAFIPKVVAGDEMVKGFIGGPVPPLLAYCLSDGKPLAKVILRSPKDDPILAVWQHGLGTSLAFTSDAQARWASRWVGWSGFGPFWSQVTRSISRRTTQNRYQMSVKNQSGKGILQVFATDSLGNPINSSDAKVRISAPDGSSKEVGLSQTAPGEYKSEFDADRLGSYILTIAESSGVSGAQVSSAGFSVPYPPEYLTTRPNKPLLGQIAKTSGGVNLTDPKQAFRSLQNPGSSISELWSLFVLLAALMLPLDVAVRRITVPFDQIFVAFRSWLTRRPRPEQTAQQEIVGRLHQAKKRVQHSESNLEPGSAATPKVQAPVNSGPPKVESKTSSSLLEAKRKRNQK